MKIVKGSNSVSINTFYWKAVMLIYFCIVCGSFYIVAPELSSCARDCMAFFLKKVHQLLLHIKKRRLNLELNEHQYLIVREELAGGIVYQRGNM